MSIFVAYTIDRVEFFYEFVCGHELMRPQRILMKLNI